MNSNSGTVSWMVLEIEGAAAPAEWRRTVGVDGDSLLVAAAIAGPENQVLRAAAVDGQKVHKDEGHCYVESRWLARNFPGCRLTVAIIEATAWKDLYLNRYGA